MYLMNAKRFLVANRGRATLVSVAVSLGVALVGLTFYSFAFTTTAAGENGATGGGVEVKDRALSPKKQNPSGQAPSLVHIDEPKAKSLELETATARRGDWPRRLKVTGRLELNESRIAHVSSLVHGVIRQVRVELGQQVAWGEVLAYVDSREVGEAKLKLVRHQLELQAAEKDYQWHKSIHENTRALLAALAKDDPAMGIGKALRDRPVGNYREQLVSALARLKRAEADYDRLRSLGANSVVPEKEVIRARAEHASAEAGYQALVEQIKFDSQRRMLTAYQRLQEAEAAVAISRSQLFIFGYTSEDIDTMDPIAEGKRVAYYPLRSPFAGTVIAKEAPLSKHVDAETELFQIADLSTVWLRADVFEKDLAAIHELEGKPVTFRTTTYADRQFTAEIFSLGDLVDDDTRAVRLLAKAPNTERLLKPGMFVEIELDAGADDEILQVASAAVHRHDGAAFVFIKRGRTEFERREVQLGRANSEVVEVIGGLAADEPVVVKGGFGLKSEMLSELMTED